MRRTARPGALRTCRERTRNKWGDSGNNHSTPGYGLLAWAWPEVAYLHRMLDTLVVLLAVMALITVVRPLAEPRRLPVREGFDMSPSRPALAGDVVVVLAALAFFWAFR